jgi:RNA polymerase sigma-70 factor (ECF subfamily)
MNDSSRMTSDDEKDSALVVAIASGESEAIGILYDRHAPMLYAIALRILRSQAEAEDVLHDAMLLVWERAHAYARERGSVAAWLITLVRNLSIDRIRTKSRRASLSARFGDVLVPAPAADPEQQLGDASAAGAVRAALDRLPEEQRQVLVASFFEGLTYSEIAALQGVPLGTVKSRAARAMQALCAALSG